MDKYKNNEINHLINLIKKINPDIVGISLISTFYHLSTIITQKIKKEVKSRPFVVWGGVHAIIDPIPCLKYADAVCIGDGEIPILNLCKSIREGKKNFKIENMFFNKKGKIVKNEIVVNSDLDSLPFPDIDDKNKYYLDNGKIKKYSFLDRPVYTILTSRGCPFSCTYCCNSVLHRIFKGKHIRRRTVSHVIEELKIAKSKLRNLKCVNFDDDVFTLDKNWLLDFSKEYKKEIGIPFTCFFRPSQVNLETISLLVECGLCGVNIGIQSGSERIRTEYYNRFDTNKQILNISRLIKSYSLDLYVDIILENKFETRIDKLETLKLLLQLPRPYRLSMSSMTYFPHTKFTEMSLKEGKIKTEDIEDKAEKIFSRKWMPSLSIKRNKEDLLFDCLYFMANHGFNKNLIYKLEKSKFFNKNPIFLTRLLRIISWDIWSVDWNSPFDKIRFHLIRAIIKLGHLFKNKKYFI